ncbi:ATP-binding protein [Actinomadura sp. 6N118]|uniref:sensor histidine kinase n=1 Tax=Actinomadura sp. 6N118 TaxID=3375151 RepID=UPI00379CDE89
MRLRPRTLAGELFALQLAIVAVVLVAVGAISLAQSSATFDDVEKRRVTALAEQFAWNPLVRTQLAEGFPSTVLATLVQSTRLNTGVTSVTVADARGVVLSSTDPTLTGTRLPLGGVPGRGWSGYLTVNGSRELTAQIPVLGDGDDNGGTRLGTVAIGVAAPTSWERLVGATHYLPLYVGIASALGLFGSLLVARRIKRQTLGLEPREITGMAEHREALLHGIAEGVIALDPRYRITLVNDVGRRLLGLPTDCLGRALADFGLESRLVEVLTGVSDARDEIVIREGRVLVLNRMAVVQGGRALGSVTTLRDRTELAQLERELGSFRGSTELLRAQAHEFANQLHVISGLIQVGDHDAVVPYVRALQKHRESLDTRLNAKVRDTAIAALLMAKSSLASERKVELRISDPTSLDKLPPQDSADLATVIGNLVDNAVDAAAGHEDAWVEVELRHDASAVEIVVRDSGPGVAPELASEVFARGFTTKAARSGERGIGLALTQLVCHRHGGEISVDGSVFTAHMSVGALETAP